MTANSELRDGEPCGHIGCLNHVTHPCEGCGRIAGHKVKALTNSEQVKAIADELVERIKAISLIAHKIRLDGKVTENDIIQIQRQCDIRFADDLEALSTQPTVTASAEELAEKIYSVFLHNTTNYGGVEILHRSTIMHEISLIISELTAEVERLKLFRKNVVEFLLLSEKQGSIVSSNQCTDTETAFASADDRFFVVDNSANDKYQNLGFVYRKASRGKDEAVTAQHTANRKD